MKRARIPLALLLVFGAARSWSGSVEIQTKPETSYAGFLEIDEAAFEVAVATGGFFYFWQPGEFSRLAAGDGGDIFATDGRVVEQIEGELRGSIELPFEVEAQDARIGVRAGLQSLGEIELYAPGSKHPYANGRMLRTAHMLFADVPEPTPGIWTVRLTGAGLYLVQVTSRSAETASEISGGEPERRINEVSEREIERPVEDGNASADQDLASFHNASGDDRWDHFRELPEPRREALARALLDDRDPRVAYVAAGWLARLGHLDEAVPVYARILVRGENETALNGRMGYDWIHADDETLAARILEALTRHLSDHLDDYSATERIRARDFLRRRAADPAS